MSEQVSGLEAVGSPAHRSRGQGPPVLLAGIGLMLTALLLIPPAYLAFRAAGRGWRGAAEVLIDGSTAVLALRSFGLAAAVTLSAAILGTCLAWMTSRTDLPARRVWTLLLALPLVIPSYLAAFSYVGAFGPVGVLQRVLSPLGVERLPEIYGAFGAWLVLTLFTYPYIFLSVRSAIAGIDPGLEEAAATLSLSRSQVVLRVILPQLRPGITMGALMVALYTLHDFGAVSILRFDTFTRAIFVQYQSSFDRTAAALLSLMLVAATILILYFEIRTRGGASYFPVQGLARRPAAPYRLGRWKLPSLFVCLLVTLATLGVTLGTVGYWLGRAITNEGLPLDTPAAALNSVKASLLGALLVVAAAVPLVLLSVRYRGKISHLAERVTFIGHALPGVVVALALVFFGARIARPLYQTPVMLGFAYVILFLPLAAGAIRSSLLQVSPRLEEAARSLGSDRTATLLRVTLPLVRPGIVGGAALAFLTVMKELPATLLLAPIGFKTLATRVWGATSAASLAEAALPALTLIVISSIPLAILLFQEGETRELIPS